MKILSLDLSTTSTGVAIMEDKKLLDYHLIKPKAKDDVVNRIQYTVLQLKEILSNNLDIDLIILEEVRPDTFNMNTQKVLLWAQGAIIFMVHDVFPNMRIEYILPSSWRKLCGIKTGRGIKREELKQADIQFVLEKYGVEVNDDVADAIGIGYAYFEMY